MDNELQVFSNEEKAAEQGQFIAVQEQQLAQLKPKADYYDVTF